MIAPSQTDVLPRRIAASAIDIGSVLLVWGLVLYRVFVRFHIADRAADGTPLYSEFQQLQLESIGEGINTGFTLGDYYYSFHGRGLVLAALCLLIFSVIAWVLVPANTGWSVGHRAMNLRVTDLRGNKPPLDSYLRRYLVGVVDLFPYVIPGALGWIIASRNDLNQRIGDLTADTLVVDVEDALYEKTEELTTTLIRPSAASGKDAAVLAADQVSETLPAPANDDLISIDLDRALAAHTVNEDYPVLDLEDTSIPTTSSDFVESLADHEAGVKDDKASPDDAYASEWHFPESADAPVWTPETAANNGPSPAAVRAVKTTDSSATSSPTETASTAELDAARSAGLGEPVWNEQWSAWLYWEADGERWLRHDAAKGWIPIEDSQSV